LNWHGLERQCGSYENAPFEGYQSSEMALAVMAFHTSLKASATPTQHLHKFSEAQKRLVKLVFGMCADESLAAAT
jgi:hypothetical protein